MFIIVNKTTKSEDIADFLRKINTPPKQILIDFYGKLEGVFGDGLEYQKMQRSEGSSSK